MDRGSSRSQVHNTCLLYTSANNVNRFRLGTEGDYYNSGVLLMDLERCRNEIHTEELFDYVSNHGDELILPDQDILNALYGGRVLACLLYTSRAI